MTATIYQFVPRQNPKRDEPAEKIECGLGGTANRYFEPDYSNQTDCGNAIWPWPEKDGA